MTNNLNNHKSKYFLIPYVCVAIVGVIIIQFTYSTFTSPSKYIEQSNTSKASGNYKAALDALNTAIKLDSKNPQLYIDRAEVREKLGDESGFIEDYKKAIQLNAKNATFYSNRAEVRYGLGDKQGAIKDWQQAANLHLEQGDTKKYAETIERIKLFQ